MKRILSALLVSMLCAGACVAQSPEGEPSDIHAADDTGDDLEIGAVVDSPDPAADPDPCLDLDACDEVIVSDAPADETGAAPAEEQMTKDGYVAGAQLLTRTYARMRKSPNADAPEVTGIEPQGGVEDEHLHLWGNPAGMLSPAQRVTLVDPAAQNGFYNVKYDGKTGWIHSKKLILTDPAAHPVDFAMKHPNMFFKHQVHRAQWNKDGPRKSGSCAPTSLAMAARILGREPVGLSVEQSIHRIRRLYEQPIDEASDTAGTTRAEIYEAATSDELDLAIHPMTTDHASPADALTALDKQLGKKRLVVLEGSTGVDGKDPSTYQKAFNKIYAAALKAGKTLYHHTYDFQGAHSILVLGKDAEGRYVVGDPMSEVGFVAIGPGAMKDFMSRLKGHRGTGNAVWRD